jgi:hypothetical protein
MGKLVFDFVLANYLAKWVKIGMYLEVDQVNKSTKRCQVIMLQINTKYKIITKYL